MINVQRLVDNLFDKPQDKRNYLGASAIGNPCERAVQYYWLTILGQLEPKDVPPRIKRIFHRGYVYEEQMAKWMKECGFVFETDDTKLQFEDFDGRFRGHCDGIIVSGLEGVTYPVLWENKCLNNNSWNQIKETDVKTSKYGYWCQVQMYLSYLGLDKCLFTIINADTMAIYTELIKLNTDKVEELKKTVEHIFERTENNKLVSKTSDKYHCRYCDYKETCEK